MNVQLETTIGPVLRQDARTQPVPAREQIAAPSAAPAVAVTTAAEGDRATLSREDQERRQDGQRQQARQADAEPSPAPRGSAYEHKLAYEQELKRLFVDIVDREDEKDRLMRIPPEKLARYLRDLEAGVSSAGDVARRIDAVT